MTHQVDAAAAWIYRGVWASVVGFFKVPEEPSTLPAAGEPVRSLRPSPGYLQYLKFLFWVALIPGDILPVLGWVAVSIAVPVLGVVLALPFLALMFLPDIFAYVGIHLVGHAVAPGPPTRASSRRRPSRISVSSTSASSCPLPATTAAAACGVVAPPCAWSRTPRIFV